MNALAQLLGLAPEHLHPLIVHFPLALLITATLCYWASLVFPIAYLEGASLIMGAIGSVCGWLALESGELAEKTLGASLCAQPLLEKHSESCETAIIFFASAFGIAIFLQLVKSKLITSLGKPLWLRFILGFVMLLGSLYLLRGGHAGFQLVYKEGAATPAVVKRCK